MTNVLIVASSPADRESLRRRAESADVRVVGESQHVESAGDATLPIDVVLLDGEHGLDEVAPAEDTLLPAVVVLGDPDDAGLLSRIRELGSPGWAVLGRDAPGPQVRAALLAAAAGLAAVPAPAGSPLGATVEPVAGDDEEDGDYPESLTARERDVLALVGLGLSNREIGGRLGISEHTAKFHVASILGKLGAHGRADAVRRGIRRGLVTV